MEAEDSEEDVEFASDHMHCEEQKKLLVSAKSCTLNQHVTPTEKSLHFSISNPILAAMYITFPTGRTSRGTW